MAIAVNLRCDNETCAPLRRLWEVCGALEPSPSMAALHYPPHITLAVYPQIDLNVLRAVFDTVFRAGREPITVRFESMGSFEAPERLIAWARPADPQPLKQLAGQIHQLIGTSRCNALYRPDAWVPHCSLATQISPEKRPALKALLQEKFEPVEVAFDAADFASFPPVRVIHERTATRC